MMERGPSMTSHQLVCSRSLKCENMQLWPPLRMASGRNHGDPQAANKL